VRLLDLRAVVFWRCETRLWRRCGCVAFEESAVLGDVGAFVDVEAFAALSFSSSPLSL
jgi:hypothetical protein